MIHGIDYINNGKYDFASAGWGIVMCWRSYPLVLARVSLKAARQRMGLELAGLARYGS